MLTAKDEAELRVKALIEGAVDYMIKPFSFEELLARIYARIPNRFPHLFDEVVPGQAVHCNESLCSGHRFGKGRAPPHQKDAETGWGFLRKSGQAAPQS